METWRERLSSRLRYLKDRDGLTQQGLADRLGVAQSTVAGWLHGRREPETLQQFERLAEAVECHPAWLLYGMEESEEEHALMQVLRGLPAERLQIVRNLAHSLVEA